MLSALHVAVAKNLKGVVLLDPSEDHALDMLRWLARRFRYRDLGFTPLMIAKLKPYGMRLRAPLRELFYPSADLEKLTEIFSENFQIPLELAELLVFSSLYISPAILIGESYKPYIEPISCSIVRTKRDLTVNDWKLHLRIAGYTILDLYEDSIVGSSEAIRDIGRYKSIIEERKERISRDTRRYWRIIDTDGKPIVYYVDNLELAFKTGIQKVESCWISCLSIVTVVNLSRDIVRV